MSIANEDSRMANLHLSGIDRRAPGEELGEHFAARLAEWRSRKEQGRPGAELLQVPGVAYFIIDRTGRVQEYWPSTGANDLSESLFREFSEEERVWEQATTAPVCVELSYQVFSEPGQLDQVLCPWQDETGKVAGFVVVTGTKQEPPST